MNSIKTTLAAVLALGFVATASVASAAEQGRRDVIVANFDRQATDAFPLGAKCTVPADVVPEVEGTDAGDVLVKVTANEPAVKGSCSEGTIYFMPKKVYNGIVDKADKRTLANAGLALRASTVLAKKAADEQLATATADQMKAFAEAKEKAGGRKIR